MAGFEIIEMPSGGGLFIKGQLIQKKLTTKSKRLIFLCFPKTLLDVQFLFENLKNSTSGSGSGASSSANSASNSSSGQSKDMEVYGHITLAAISGKNLFWR